VGDGLRHLMRPSNVFFPIVTTNQTKVQIINLVNGLFQDDRLHIQPGTELDKQIREQQVDRTDAGNVVYRHSGKHDDLFWALGYACLVASPYMSGVIRPIMRTPKNDFRENLDDRIEEDMKELLQSEI
jgi:hypothetical protein